MTITVGRDPALKRSRSTIGAPDAAGPSCAIAFFLRPVFPGSGHADVQPCLVVKVKRLAPES
jgi:hypothetical protein